MSRANRIGLHPELANATWTLWAKHEKVPRWLAIRSGMRHSLAIDEMVTRQDRVRRSGQPCIFKLVEDGMPVDDRAAKAPVSRRSK